MSKYRAVKVTMDGKIFDSKKEARRYVILKDMERHGEIRDLQTQVRFQLIPSQRENGKCIEREVSYKADFVYWQNGKMIVEDTKGVRTPEYVIKRKLMLWVHGIKVKEI